MNSFFNLMIVLGLVGTLILFLILLLCAHLCWWQWIIAVISFALVEFGCFAYCDKKNAAKQKNNE